MEPAGKQRRIGVMSVAAALVAVAVFWEAIFPHTAYYKKRQRKTQIEERLRSISTPAGASVKITTVDIGGHLLAVGNYEVSADWESVKTHYKGEFPKHGFIYSSKTNGSGADAPTLTFTSPEYDATLSGYLRDGYPLTYLIILTRKNARD
jgi:hypothetical protein